MFSEADIGVLPQLGVYDLLGLIQTCNMARYEVMEMKHGRAAMLGFLHVISVEAGAKIPTDECLTTPTGLIASLKSMPTFAWLQIMLFCCIQETGAGTESSFFSLASTRATAPSSTVRPGTLLTLARCVYERHMCCTRVTSNLFAFAALVRLNLFAFVHIPTPSSKND